MVNIAEADDPDLVLCGLRRGHPTPLTRGDAQPLLLPRVDWDELQECEVSTPQGVFCHLNDSQMQLVHAAYVRFGVDCFMELRPVS